MPTEKREQMGLRPLILENLLSVDGQEPTVQEGEWICENLRFTYPHTRSEALHVEQISLPKGSVTAVIGHNGAGKTTFLRCLSGLQKHSGGILRMGSEKYGRKQRLKQCYMVMQDVNHQLFTEQVLEEVLLSMPEENIELAEQYLAQMDLTEVKDHHPMALSGGQKQRLAVASAYASQRPLILFDEPTSGLDLCHMKEVAEILGKLFCSRRTVVVVTHDPEFILRSCHRVVHPYGTGRRDSTEHLSPVSYWLYWAASASWFLTFALEESYSCSWPDRQILLHIFLRLSWPWGHFS